MTKQLHRDKIKDKKEFQQLIKGRKKFQKLNKKKETILMEDAKCNEAASSNSPETAHDQSVPME